MDTAQSALGTSVKLKEKLAKGYIGEDRWIADSERGDLRDAFIVGFEKAREMASEIFDGSSVKYAGWLFSETHSSLSRLN